MHELLHIIGLCPDSIGHLDLIDLAVANYQNIQDIKIKTIIQYVTKRRSSHRVINN